MSFTSQGHEREIWSRLVSFGYAAGTTVTHGSLPSILASEDCGIHIRMISDLWTEFKMDQYYPMVTKIYYLDIKTEVLVYSYTNISHINAKH